VPFNLTETAGGLRHLLLKATRVLNGRQPTYYLALLSQENLSCRALRTPAGEIVCCKVCGFVLVELELATGWLARLCSAWLYFEPNVVCLSSGKSRAAAREDIAIFESAQDAQAMAAVDLPEKGS